MSLSAMKWHSFGYFAVKISLDYTAGAIFGLQRCFFFLQQNIPLKMLNRCGRMSKRTVTPAVLRIFFWLTKACRISYVLTVWLFFFGRNNFSGPTPFDYFTPHIRIFEKFYEVSRILLSSLFSWNNRDWLSTQSLRCSTDKVRERVKVLDHLFIILSVDFLLHYVFPRWGSMWLLSDLLIFSDLQLLAALCESRRSTEWLRPGFFVHQQNNWRDLRSLVCCVLGLSYERSIHTRRDALVNVPF